MLSRRQFVATLAAPLLLEATEATQSPHPEPRPGIDARNVVPADRLGGYGADVREVFEMVREMPRIADGLRCFCGCAGREGMRSLLSCYEGGGMATDCEVCQGEARLAHRRFREGQTLAQIRRAVEARYG